MITPDMIGYAAALLTSFAFAPQALKTIRTRNTESLSLAMYALFTSGVFLWLCYGVLRDDWVIITANFLTAILALPILFLKVRDVLKRRAKK